MTSLAELTFLNHCVAASDALTTAAVQADLPRSSHKAATDLRQAGELLLQTAFAVVNAGSERDDRVLEQYHWALMKVVEVSRSMPGDKVTFIPKETAGSKKVKTKPKVPPAEKV